MAETSSGFTPLPATLDLPVLEQRVLDRWRHTDVFARSLAQTADGPLWVFYEGPPTANGKPGVHHVEPRVFKDLFPRFKTMKGHHVPRRGGWDCHGLPVELAVEKELGFSGKGDIEAYGVEAFNAKCRESVLRHVAEFEALTERMGFWIDTDDAYRTMDAAYIDSVWWSLQVIFDKGLLVEDHRVAPYCPRCGTALSDHEVAQGYQTVQDPSVYVRFPVTSGPLAEQGAALLVWTTTPWTLVSNTAVAVHPDVTYVLARTAAGELLVVAEPLLDATLGDGAEVLQRLTGRDLERTTYERPFDLVDIPDAHYVTLATYVTTEDGTGLVHTAPAFGAEDLAVAREYGLPVVNPVDAQGRFVDGVSGYAGRFFKDADADLVTDLERRGRLYRAATFEHSYPHCWRCDTALIYYALPSWYIRTTAIKDGLLAQNAKTDWHPMSIRDGRYGDWLTNNVDWSLSRSRYWGTPLPIWRCADGHLTCVGSRTELGALAGLDLRDLDPHRPFVDEVTVTCRASVAGGLCNGTAFRVPEVIDCWYDAGSMPFAQWGAPHLNAETQAARFPAQFICEAIDQTRGWFYTLMAIGTLVQGQSPYETVLCLGHLVDRDGRKMSKHLGNVLDPHELFDQYGADPLRWLLLCVGNPWANRRVYGAALDEVVRKVLLTYWNTVSFFTLYAAADGWDPAAGTPDGERPLLDRWLISELHRTVIEVDAALEDFDPTRAGRRLTEFIDDLSNWYVRRCRRRFWKGSETDDGRHAFGTLYETLVVLTELLAPFVPFITDEVWSVLHPPGTDSAIPDSVHLAPWPGVDGALVDAEIGEHMQLVRTLVELGRETRAESGVRTRQPLGRVLITSTVHLQLGDELLGLVRDELNVERVEPLTDESGLVEVSFKANFRALGKRFGSRTAVVAEQIAAWAAGTTSFTVTVDGEAVTLDDDMVVRTETPRAGWVVASQGGVTLALDTEITPELKRAGLARDVVRVLQESRKAHGLEITDRIEVWWQAAGEVAEAIREYAGHIAEEVLAVSFTEGHPAADLAVQEDLPLGLRWSLRQAGA